MRRQTRRQLHNAVHRNSPRATADVSIYCSPELATYIGRTVDVWFSEDDDLRSWVKVDGVTIETRLVTGFKRRAGQRDIITARQWVELSRLLAQRARSGFSGDELATVNGFINYVAPDVEPIQQQGESMKLLTGWGRVEADPSAGVDLSQSRAWECPICRSPNPDAPIGAEVLECAACGGEFEVLLSLCPSDAEAIQRLEKS